MFNRGMNTGLCILSAGLLVAGCARPPRPDPVYGRQVFDALQQAVEKAGNAVGPHLVLVKLQSENTGGSTRQVGGVTVRTGRSSGPKTFNGVLLTPQGHILVQEIIPPDIDDRIEAWVGEDEYQARPLKVDEQLGMTILKIDSEEPFPPIAWSERGGLATGEWAVVVTPSDEDKDFERFITLTVCRGEQAGRYGKFQLDGVPSTARGAPLVNLDGEVVGIMLRGEAISIADLREDLEVLLAEATGVRSPEDEQRQKGWMGVVVGPVAKPYARVKDLPDSGLWVLHVAAGGPAERAGLQPGDLIIRLNGEDLLFSGTRAHEFFMKSLRPRIDAPFSLTVLRRGEEVVCRGVFAKQPEPDELQAKDLGVSLIDFTDIDVFLKNLWTDQGVLVTDVQQGSPAATGRNFGRGLIYKGDVIVELAGRPTPDLETFAEVLDQVRHDKPQAVLIKYFRNRQTGYAGLNLRIGERDNGEAQ